MSLHLPNLSLGNDTNGKPSPSNRREPSFHPHMLSLIFKDGRRTAIDYAHLYRIDYDGAGEIRLQFSEDIVVLRGKFSTEKVYSDLVRRSLSAITEVDVLHDVAADSNVSVTEISIIARVESVE